MRQKYWTNCSVEEKKEFLALKKEINKNKDEYANGLISHRKYSYRKTRFAKKIDELERKYQ